jgi:hypothetical protein
MVLLSRLGGLVIWSLLLGASGPAAVSAQVSPGPLARAHRELDAALKCTRCHGGRDGMQAKCLSCHRDIAWLAERARGLHGSAPVRSARCASCHPDHAGADFALIKWPDGSADRFEHRRAGWPLEQSHAKARCADCHKPEYRVSSAAPLAPGNRSSWTGLEQPCASCHEDIHRGALGARCTTCHDAGTWTTTPGFTHDTTSYPLAGRHATVGCDQCHLAARLPLKRDGAGRPIPVYRPLPHAACSSCHADVHQGSFGPDCSSCHSIRGFKEIAGTRFAHERTGFPLKGRHAAVRCTSCHRDLTTPQGRKPGSATCATCHAPDPHAGTATLEGRPADCAACHSERGFTPSTFPLERHQTSRYPLEGKHREVRCASCHVKDASQGTARVVLRPRFAACASCHPDDHGRQLLTRPGSGECAECHTAAGWTPSRFGREAHAGSSFPLDGRHAEIACRACHGQQRAGLRPLRPGSGSLGKAGFAFDGIETGCAQCHLDPHGGRFEPAGTRAMPGGCPACHNTQSFRPATVDAAAHARFRFPLQGAHRATPCAACHGELAGAPAAGTGSLVAGPGSLRPLRFEADSTCASCHTTVHGAQFDDRKGGSRCDACHSEESFAPATRFDHDRDASFALGKGHQRVACAECHRSTRSAGAVPRVLYRPLSARCESCHLKRPG